MNIRYLGHAAFELKSDDTSVLMDTAPTRALMEAEPDGALATLVQRSALARAGQPEDIVNAAIYLASDEASWVTGSHLVVDGGASALR